MNKTKVFRSVFSTVLSFILALALVMTSLLIIAKSTLLSTSFANRVIEKSGYAESLHTELYDEFVSYGNACNIDEVFFEDFFRDEFTADFIEKDAKKYYDGIYDGAVEKYLDVSSFKQIVIPELLKFAVSIGYTDDEELHSNIDVMAQELGTIYSAFVAMPYAENISAMVTEYSKYATYGIAAGAAFALAIAGLIFSSYKKKCHPLRFIIYSFSASTLMTAVLPIYALTAKLVNKVNITNLSLYSLVTVYGNSTLKAFVISSAVTAALTVILAVIYYRMRKKQKSA